MKTKKQKSRFEQEISYWMLTHAEYTLDCTENYQEKLHNAIRYNLESIDDDERQLVVNMLHELLSLSFILQKHKDETKKFYEYWN